MGQSSPEAPARPVPPVFTTTLATTAMTVLPEVPHPFEARTERVLQGLTWLTQTLNLAVPAIVELPQLRSQPPGSFGRAWADHLDRNGLKPFTSGSRRQQLHDGIHTVTGYGMEPMGEAEVQAFLLGAKLRMTNGLLLLGLLQTIWRQQGLGSTAELRSRLRMAYRRGRACTLDPDRWQPERLWAMPLQEVQRHLEL